MGFNEFIGKLFGNKATRDMKEIKPWVDKIKAVYPEIAKLSNDELRAKTEELKKYIVKASLRRLTSWKKKCLKSMKKHWMMCFLKLLPS